LQFFEIRLPFSSSLLFTSGLISGKNESKFSRLRFFSKLKFIPIRFLCGHGVIEGQKVFSCSNWKKGCKFVIWKNDNF